MGGVVALPAGRKGDHEVTRPVKTVVHRCVGSILLSREGGLFVLTR